MVLPVYIRRGHRLVGTLWLVSLGLPLLVDTSEIPGPSIPAILFITLIISGSYLLFRPFVRGSATVSSRLNGLKTWTWKPSVVIRRTHRIAGTVFLLLLAVALAVTAVGGPEQLILIPLVIVLFYMAISGLYMFFRPWVNRVPWADSDSKSSIR